jgi:uncharacterized repeat protein (TIGR01451 family)
MSPRRLVGIWASVAVVSFLSHASTASAQAPQPRHVSNFDVRVQSAKDVARLVSRTQGTPGVVSKERARAQVATTRAGLARLRAEVPGAQVRMSSATAAPEVVTSPHGALSQPAPTKTGVDIARQFLRAHMDLYGLNVDQIDGLAFLGESKSPSGQRMVRLEQSVGGLKVFQSETRILLDADGRVWRSLGILAPSPAPSALPASLLTAPEALAAAFKGVGIDLDAAAMTVLQAPLGSKKVQVATKDRRITGSVGSELVYFPVAPGVLVPAWQLIAFTRTDADWNVVVDAIDGTVLWRKNMRAHASTQDARFNVFAQADGTTPAVSPAPHDPTTVAPGSGTQFPAIGQTTVSMSTVQNLTASPDGWIPDGGDTTTGNNVDAYLDTNADNDPDAGLLDDNGRPVGNLDGSGHNRDFLGTGYAFSPAPMGGNPDDGDSPTTVPSRRNSVLSVFYMANWYHDHLYGFGFDEAAGNFQTNNFGNGGSGGDPVLAEAQDGSGTDNSNFATPPDGTSGRMQMFIFDFPTPNRDGALDGTIVMHELTHGLSNRLIGDGNGLIWDVGGAMGEGWSDFYSLSLLHNSNIYDPDAEYAVGAYATFQFLGLTDNYLYGIRRFPYSTDNSVNPLTWGDVDDVTYNHAGGITPSPLVADFEAGGALEVHNAGEIWANTLWGVRSLIIAEPGGANGDVPTGNATTLQLVTDALKLTPINPGFVDARDAILSADCMSFGCAHEDAIWSGFANRGLGYGAVAPLGQGGGVEGAGGYVGVGASFDVPYLDFVAATVDDTLGNNNGAIDPGEPIRLSVSLLNPWQLASKGIASATATLTSSTPGVTIVTNSATYGAIAAGGTGAGTPFLFRLAPTALCGQAIQFTITSVSSLGTKAVNFTVRVGLPSGLGTPMTYTQTIPAGGLAIPDADLRGVDDHMTIADDLVIRDLNFRIDSLTHTSTGDLVIGLKAPSGYGTAMIYLRGVFIGDATGANFTNTTIDGQSTNSLALTDHTDAPYTGDWEPAFNDDIWGLFGIPNLGPDPVDQLGRLDNLSTKGTWTVHVADEAQTETGTLQTWSLIVTPQAFSCTNFTPLTANVTGTKSVSGSLTPGGAVTYTVVLSNSGTGAQPDNPGNEFTDVLPSTLTLVSASASSGTAVPTVATRTVTWNGSIPAAGSVTITIHATVNAGTLGETISNQGSISFDSDVDGVNESSGVTDNPATPAANDPTAFLVANGASLSAQKSVTGSFNEGGTVVYSIVISNGGPGPQADNPGHEMTDVLPSELLLVSASASSGTAVPTIATNTVTWDGSIASGASVTVTIHATIKAGAAGATISNQAQLSYDDVGTGTNDASAVSDDPSTPASGDPTSFEVSAAIGEVPTLSTAGLSLLGLLLGMMAVVTLRRRRAA